MYKYATVYLDLRKGNHRRYHVLCACCISPLFSPNIVWSMLQHFKIYICFMVPSVVYFYHNATCISLYDINYMTMYSVLANG